MKYHALIFRKLGKMSQNVSSASVVIDTLRVNEMVSVATNQSRETDNFSVTYNNNLVSIRSSFMCLKRGSYMSAHVLLNLLNELGKRDKMQGLSCILSLFRNEFNKFNNTSARILDTIYHITLRIL